MVDRLLHRVVLALVAIGLYCMSALAFAAYGWHSGLSCQPSAWDAAMEKCAVMFNFESLSGCGYVGGIGGCSTATPASGAVCAPSFRWTDGSNHTFINLFGCNLDTQPGAGGGGGTTTVSIGTTTVSVGTTTVTVEGSTGSGTATLIAEPAPVSEERIADLSYMFGGFLLGGVVVYFSRLLMRIFEGNPNEG